MRAHLPSWSADRVAWTRAGLLGYANADPPRSPACQAQGGRSREKADLVHASDPLISDATDDADARCQARPAAARRGFRDDPLCASVTRATVEFEGETVPLCGIHLKMYVRWGTDAAEQARQLWAWPVAEDVSDVWGNGDRGERR